MRKLEEQMERNSAEGTLLFVSLPVGERDKLKAPSAETLRESLLQGRAEREAAELQNFSPVLRASLLYR